MEGTATLTNDHEFYVVAREPGAEHPSLPTWANKSPNPANLDARPPIPATVKKIAEVPGTFQILNLLSPEECARLVELTETLGYLPDAAVSLPRKIRHNDNVTWVADQASVNGLWQRAAFAFQNLDIPLIDKPAVGLNARFRYYRYDKGDFFAPHTDGAWFGSAVVNEQLIGDAFGDRYSQYSLVLFLSDAFIGGRTEFYLNPKDPLEPLETLENANIVRIATPIGGAICFPHGGHPWHRVHSSEPIRQGIKYIIRTDVLFAL
ncbi:MAG: oxidoreductase [Pseudomonadota bacterium]